MDEMPRPPGPKTFTVSGRENFEKVRDVLEIRTTPWASPSARLPEIVTYDEHALRGLWIERDTGRRFLVTELKSDFFYACGYREFRDGGWGVFEPWSCIVGNLSYGYDRADGRIPDRHSYEGRFFVPRG